jgi:hypothetical protein
MQTQTQSNFSESSTTNVHQSRHQGCVRRDSGYCARRPYYQQQTAPRHEICSRVQRRGSRLVQEPHTADLTCENVMSGP